MTSNYRSPIFELGETFISEGAKLSPINATHLGIPGFDDQLDDYSLVGWAKKRQHVIESLDKLKSMTPRDDVDRIAKAVMKERLESDLALFNAEEHQITCAVISSPIVNIRQVFELMPSQTEEEISTITKRLIQVESSLKSWLSTLDDLSKRGKVAASRQIKGIANQLDKFSQGTFSGLTERFDPERKYPELHAAGIAADESAATASEWLKREYLSRTTNIDAVGEERFSLWASHYTGAKLDLRATYEWGMADLAQINQRMWRVARKLLPEANSLREVADFLEADPKYKIFGTDTLLEKLKAFTAETTAKMDGIHFDIDESIKFYDVKLAPKEVLRHLITSPQVKTCRALVRLGSLRKVRPNLVGGGCHRCGTTKLFQVIIYKQPLRSLSRII